jgi:hypothetical protein
VQKAIDCGGPKDKLYDQKAELFIQMFELKQAEQAFREAIKNTDGNLQRLAATPAHGQNVL